MQPGPEPTTDRDCLRAFARRPSAESFRPFLDRYLPLVYSAASRQLGDPGRSADVTKAVFLAFAYRAKRLRRKTVLAGWLFRATRLACQKLPKLPQPSQGAPPSLSRLTEEGRGEGPLCEGPVNLPPSPMLVPRADAAAWEKAAPELDAAVDRLPMKLRDALLVRVFLQYHGQVSKNILRVRESRAQKRAERAFPRLAKRLRKRAARLDPAALALCCAREGCTATPPTGLAEELATLAPEAATRKPRLDLVRRTLRALTWTVVRRRLRKLAVASFVAVALGTVTVLSVKALVRNPRALSFFIEWSVRRQAKSVPGLAQPARPWPAENAQLAPALPRAQAVHAPADFFQITNIWLAHLEFSPGEWASLEPRRIDPLPDFLQPDSTVLLRNPKAQRSGLAGVLGYDFDWAHGNFEVSGARFPDVAARFKGNGTYLSSLYGLKRSFKVDLHKFNKQQRLGGVEEINFSNLVEDRSYMSDALAYELFRDAGVPAPRTAYAWLTVTVPGQWDRKPFGLYVVVENLGSAFAAEHLGSKKAPIFKPVTYDLFQDLGQDWAAYDAIYDIKTRATDAQKRRVIDFAQLVTHANDTEFAGRVGDFLDLDEFARFLSGLVLLASYDGFLSDGQNFYLYLDPASNKFGFMPWDLDHAWGAFPFVATPAERERASIWHPWVGRNRFLERVLAVEEFRRIYRARLTDCVEKVFVPTRLADLIDTIARVIRSPIAAESTLRLGQFDQAVSAKWLPRPLGPDDLGANRPVHQLKRFIETRARSVRRQLQGTAQGMRLYHSSGRE